MEGEMATNGRCFSQQILYTGVRRACVLLGNAWLRGKKAAVKRCLPSSFLFWSLFAHALIITDLPLNDAPFTSRDDSLPLQQSKVRWQGRWSAMSSAFFCASFYTCSRKDEMLQSVLVKEALRKRESALLSSCRCCS